MTSYPNAAVQFQRVNYSIDGVRILKDITGYFPKGEITTLIGPSGAGKTTLFRLCNGLKSPNSGEIHIKNEKIEAYEPVKLRRNVAIALQSATMLSGSVQKNLAMPLTLQGKQLSEERAQELMRMVDLDPSFLRKNSKDLSGGQRQKLSIARTLVNQPEILLLDEITSSLDRVSQQDIEALIKQINQKYGTTIIWITHNLQQARTIGAFTWVMMDGKVIESGKSDLLDDPENLEVKRFVKGELE
ncbi:phosphate ABC transporter ATP-binding protein [Virgibacillus sp. NKC19-3]|uniref:ABC transporter ATP-binding protein n=1 Tax=Virgibacillus saliphilus TaxID=2831674 RepID=UPI001C9B61CB|nr:phosphate ABC transporter ATP-binding protein [Virgibacillus sp. NKC19-3]MBY7142507.1 phosphate ABC transporter ATP-binding protein [Virgibacillus sp. NKC19-3]